MNVTIIDTLTSCLLMILVISYLKIVVYIFDKIFKLTIIENADKINNLIDKIKHKRGNHE